MSRSAACLLTLVFLLTTPAIAQPKPVEARGFSPGEVYDYSGLDSVNLFNGNLVLALPLGGKYPLGGGFSYGLRLTYNAKVWDVETRRFSFSEAAFEARVSDDFNAGVGWTVSLGGYLTNHEYADNPNGWNLTTEDGAEHHFYQSLHIGEATGTAHQYTRDDTYLRLRKATREVEYPDGTIRTYGESEPGVPGKFRLTSIRDRFGNVVTVTYNDGANPSWQIQDGLRTHRVDFETGATGKRRVKAVKLAAFNGSVATYAFGYATKTITRSCWDSPSSFYPNPSSDPTPETATVDLLTSLTLPGNAGAFEMLQHYEDCAPSKNAPGVLKRLRLPTRGLIDWTYTDWEVLTRSPLTLNQGPDTEPAIGAQDVLAVASKTVLNSNGLCEDYDWPSCTWTYRTESSGLTRQVIVKEPSGDETVHYFANSPHLNRTTFTGWEYGLPFHLTNVQGGLHLSRQIYDGTAASGVLKRSVRVAYEHDKLKPGETISFSSDWYDSNRRPRVERTIFHDDGGAWVETVSSDFDGLGQHREQATTASWGSDRSTTTTYNPARGTYSLNPANNQFASSHSFSPWPDGQPWLLRLSTSSETQDGSDRVRVETCFDPNTGFLERQRRLEGTSRGGEDVIVEYQAGAFGAVTRERHYGGDHAALPTDSSWCSDGLGTPDYQMAHTIEHRLSAKTKFLAPNGGTLPVREGHFVRNLTLDQSTGLPKRSVDPAGLATDYAYDALGRLTAEKPTSGAWVEYEYLKALSTRLARTNVRRRPNGETSGPALTWEAFWYDSFGRVRQERQELPGGVTSKQVSSHYPNGWLRSQTVAHASGTSGDVAKTLHQSYDPFGRPAKIVPPDGDSHALDFEYRGIRQVKRTVSVATGAAGQETPQSTIERSDAYGRLIEVVEPSGPGGADISTFYTYDAAHRLTRVRTTAHGVTQTRTFEYDGRGFLLRETHPELGTAGNGTLVFSDYDALGNAGRRRVGGVDGAFDLLQDYDRQGRLIEIKERRFVNGQQRPLKEFLYGTGAWSGNRSLGKVETAIRHNWLTPPWNPSAGEVDVSVQEVYTFGGVGGQPSKRRTTLSTFQTFEQSWTYDDLGKVLSKVYPQCLHPPCSGTTGSRTVPHTYTRGRLTAMAGYAPSITYHDHGMLDTVTHANGTRTYHRKDPFGIRRPGSIGASGIVGVVEQPLGDQGLVYQYDGAGNVKFLGDEVYQYDPVSRVVKGTLGGGNSQSYAYDAFGNISAVTTVRSGVTTTRGYGIVKSTNRLTATAYDAAGNQLHFGAGTTGYSYTWDGLSKLRSKRNGTGTIQDYYLYTADDERINTLHWAESPVEETWTLRDLGGQVLRTWETVGGSSGTWTHREDHVHRDGQLLASWRPAEGLRFFHLDHLGTPRIITKADGRSAGLYTYFPFGEESVPNGSTERMKFTGHERDMHGTAGQGDDLDYMHARYCNPLNGRFLSVDPARESAKPGAPQSWNRYAYGRGNPVKFVDPDGRETSVALALERDIQSLQDGEITTQQYHDNIKARATGGAVGVATVVGGKLVARVATAIVGAATSRYLRGRLAKALGQSAKTTASPSVKEVKIVSNKVLSGGRSGSKVKSLQGPPNSALKGGGERIFVTNDKGQVVLDITKQRVKPVSPGRGFGPKREPTKEELELLRKVLESSP